MGDESLVHGDPRLALKRGQLVIEHALHALEVLFGAADGAVFVNGPGDLGSDVGVGNGLHARGQHPGREQGIDPHFPVFTAHDSDGLRDVIALRGLDGHFIDHTGAGVEVLVGVGVARGLEDRFENLAGLRMRAAWRGEAVNDAIDLFEVGLDSCDDFFLDWVRIGVAIERARIQPGSLGFVFNSGGVIPASRRGAICLTGTLEKDPDGGSP